MSENVFCLAHDQSYSNSGVFHYVIFAGKLKPTKKRLADSKYQFLFGFTCANCTIVRKKTKQILSMKHSAKHIVHIHRNDIYAYFQPLVFQEVLSYVLDDMYNENKLNW
jgi:hypothetical protein